MNNVSYRVALGGIISSLCLLAMFLTGVMPLFYLALPMIAGILILVMMVEVNTGWAWLTYLAVSILSLFVTFDKEASIMFVMFFGHYPILHQYIKKIKNNVASWFTKFLVYNVCVVTAFKLMIFLLGAEEILEEFHRWGKYGAIAFLAVTNLVFVVYDKSIDSCLKMYKYWLRPKITGKGKLK